jgi:YD repeat-containing protein
MLIWFLVISAVCASAQQWRSFEAQGFDIKAQGPVRVVEYRSTSGTFRVARFRPDHKLQLLQDIYDPSVTTTKYVYDAAGQLLEIRRNGERHIFTYASDGKLIRQEQETRGQFDSGQSEQQITYEYNEAGLLHYRRHFNFDGHLSAREEMTYDPAGRLVCERREQQVSGEDLPRCVVSRFEYDDSGRLKEEKVTLHSGEQSVSTFSHRDDGSRVVITFTGDELTGARIEQGDGLPLLWTGMERQGKRMRLNKRCSTYDFDSHSNWIHWRLQVEKRWLGLAPTPEEFLAPCRKQPGALREWRKIQYYP